MRGARRPASTCRRRSAEQRLDGVASGRLSPRLGAFPSKVAFITQRGVTNESFGVEATPRAPSAASRSAGNESRPSPGAAELAWAQCVRTRLSRATASANRLQRRQHRRRSLPTPTTKGLRRPCREPPSSGSARRAPRSLAEVRGDRSAPVRARPRRLPAERPRAQQEVCEAIESEITFCAQEISHDALLFGIGTHGRSR